MTAKSRKLFVRPLFYDALSGEFNPPTEHKKGAHTLGRLMVATFDEGTQMFGIQRWGSGRGSMFSYQPPWASKVQSTLKLERDFDSDILQAVDLTLTSSEGSELSVRDLPVRDQGSRIIAIASPMGETRMELQLGEEIAAARLAVAQSAQAFFNQLGKSA